MTAPAEQLRAIAALRREAAERHEREAAEREEARRLEQIANSLDAGPEWVALAELRALFGSRKTPRESASRAQVLGVR